MKIKKLYINISLLVLLLSLSIAGAINKSFKLHNNLETPKTSDGEISIITPENKTYTEPDNGYYPATFGFENEFESTSGTLIKFIDGMSASAYCLIYSNYFNHNNIFEFQSTDDPHFAYHHLSSQKTAGIVEFYVNFDESNENHTIGLYETTDSLDGAIQLSWRDNGYLSYYDGSWNDIETYTSNMWYHVKIEFIVSGIWHLWIDNVQKDSSGYSFLGSISYVEYFWIQGSSTADIKFDAIGFSWDPYYSIGNNLNEGLLLSYQNTTTLDWQGYSLDGATNKTILGNTTIPMPTDGFHNVQVYGNDSLGTMYESDLRYFAVSTSAPQLTINSPVNSEIFGTTAPNYDLSIIDLYDTIWYTLDDGATNFTVNGLTGSINQAEWDKLGDGSITIRFYVHDIADREIFEEVIVVKRTTGIPGFNLIALISITSLFTIIIINRKSKK